MPAGEDGFTLFELVMTMVIIAILAIFVSGRMDFASAFVERGVYDKTRAGIEFARKAAVAQRRYVCVCVGAGCTPANSAVFTLDTRAPESSVTFCNGSSEVALALPAPDRDCSGNPNAICSRTGVTIAHVSGGPSFSFDPTGGASARVEVSVTGQATNIVVEAQTGYVH